MSVAEAMRRAKLPSHIRWLGGSIIDTQENGVIVAHGILTNDPRTYLEKRCYAPVACETEGDVDYAIAAAIDRLTAESTE